MTLSSLLMLPGSPTSVLTGGLNDGIFSKTCKCSQCKVERNRPPPSVAVSKFNRWGREVAAELTEKLHTLGLSGWVVKWVDWDDCSRLKGSCWGSNITDFRQKLFKDGYWLSCFVIGTQNYNPTGVYLPLKQMECVKRDAATGETKQTTVYDLLKNAGTEFAHLGLPHDCDLTQGEDQQCFFRVQVTIAMVGEGEEANLGTFGCNYQAGEVPRNVTLLCWGQDTIMADDRKSAGEYEARYLTAEYKKETDSMEEFYTCTDATKRTIAQSGTETKEEAVEAIRQGKSCEVRLGPKDGRKSSAQMFVQIPIDRAAVRQRIEMADESKSPAPKKHKSSPEAPPPEDADVDADAPAPVEVETEDADDAEAPVDGEEAELVKAEDCPHKDCEDLVYRSLCSAGGGDDNGGGYQSLSGGPAMEMGGVAEALTDAARVDELSGAVNCKMGRFYKGAHVGRQRALYGNNLKPDSSGGLVTCTLTHVVTCPPDQKPTFEDVVQLIKLAHGDLQHAVDKCGGTAENLMSDFAAKLGHTTPTITAEAAKACAETVAQIQACPAAGVPTGLFN